MNISEKRFELMKAALPSCIEICTNIFEHHKRLDIPIAPRVASMALEFADAALDLMAKQRCRPCKACGAKMEIKAVEDPTIPDFKKRWSVSCSAACRNCGPTQYSTDRQLLIDLWDDLNRE